ncbi:MAG TPA: NAD(P)-binding domain-containing protein, partial [Pyrinomonadaceae bacterium]|nr:NAD(P)-binding domain-containing protein [Pyrinomonadaceae bacterium]
MKKSQILIIVALLILLLALNWGTRADLAGKEYFGGLPWYGWAGISLFLIVLGVVAAIRDAARARKLLEEPPPAKHDEADQRIFLSKELLEKYDPDGPNYPHPVIVAERCIGCHACVDACPHDVLAIVNGISTPIARDQCMEDTSCQVECPVNPKACIVVNTTKKIKPRQVPKRDASFMTDVPGVYLIGDVSGTPLIKNAANEGASVAVHIAHELHAADGNGGPPQAQYDVAIIGAGPAGLSAAVMAKRLGLSYVGIEQDTVMSTIVKYPKKKYVFLKPETMEWTGGIRLPGLEEYVEETLAEIVDDPDRARIKDLLTAERAGTIDDAGQKLLNDARDRYQQLLEAELLGQLD